MLEHTIDLLNAIESDNRELSLYIDASLQAENPEESVIERIFPSELVDNVTINYSGAKNNRLSIGEFCKSQLTFTLTKDMFEIITGSSFINRKFFVSIEVNSTHITLNGGFWFYEYKEIQEQNKIQVIAYDLPPVFSEIANPSSTKVSDILTEIETLTKMTIQNKENLTLEEINGVGETDTWMDLLGYIAGYDGYNIKTSIGAKLVLYKYTQVDDYEIKKNIIYENSFTTNENVTISNYHIIGENGIILDVGNGYGIRYTNPYITQITDITDYLDKTYTPMNVKIFGNPLIEIGDIISVDGHTCYVMNHELIYDGGLVSKIDCYADKEQEALIPIAPVDRKIKVIQNNINKIVNHFYVDDDGVHVTEYEGDSLTGNNVLVNGQALQIRDGTEVKASFGSDVVIGNEDSSRIIINDEELQYYNKDNELAILFDMDAGITTGRADVTESASGNTWTTEPLRDTIQLDLSSLLYVYLSNSGGYYAPIAIAGYDGWGTSRNNAFQAMLSSEDNKIYIKLVDETSSATLTSIRYVYSYSMYASNYSFGNDNDITGKFSMAIGTNNTIASDNSLAIGVENVFKDSIARDTFENAIAAGTSIVVGKDNETDYHSNIIVGRGNNNSGVYNALFGFQNTASSYYGYNIIGGIDNTVTGSGGYCAVFGSGNTSNGDGELIAGIDNVANKSNSVVFGSNNIANADNQVVIGQYNSPDTTSALIIGNGDSANRRNILTLSKKGVMNFYANTQKEIPSSNYYGEEIYLRRDDGQRLADFQTLWDSNDNSGMIIEACRNINGTNYYNTVRLLLDSSGNRVVQVSQQAPWRTALGVPPTSHASTAKTYGLGTTANYGHVKTINALNTSAHADGLALSAYQGKVLNDLINAKGTATGAGAGSTIADKSISSGTSWVNLGSFSLASGTWLVILTTEIASNATGRRALGISTTSGGNPIGINTRAQCSAVNGGYTTLNITCVLTPTATTTYYVNALQNSGTSLNCQTRYTLVKLK